MKKSLNAVLVVEGKSDVSFLSSFIDAEFVITNGFALPKETIEYLKTISASKEIIVLTDPDFPGKNIRTKLDEQIPNLKHCFVSKEVSIKHGKVGVAESTKEEVLNALENCFVAKRDPLGTLTTSDLYELGLLGNPDSSYLRNKVSEQLHIGHTNAKLFLHRVNSLNISFDELKGMIQNG